MGRYTCVRCSRSYSDRRFIWESDGVPDGVPAKGAECGDKESKAEEWWDTSTTGQGSPASSLPVTPLTQEGEESEELSPASDGLLSKFEVVGGVSQPADREFGGGETSGTTPSSANLTITPESVQHADTLSLPSPASIVDTLRFTGTAANITGVCAPVTSVVCSPICAVTGVVGLAGGLVQLHSGFATPSGDVDPHLVTKGGITSVVGGTCMILGILACSAPPLFLVSLGLGFAGLGAATLVDSAMDGLCSDCRGRSCDTEAVPAADADALQPDPAEEPGELAAPKASVFLVDCLDALEDA
mmetsp:Transcript_39534/g.113793  ORF Transcript_39534/g.113793 Transcript_39534/m.113793 type:complete len:301 (-) Transcript_39534:241-1143(-)